MLYFNFTKTNIRLLLAVMVMLSKQQSPVLKLVLQSKVANWLNRGPLAVPHSSAYHLNKSFLSMCACTVDVNK